MVPTAKRPASAIGGHHDDRTAEVGLLELAKQLSNVSQACKMMGYSRDGFYRFCGASPSPGTARQRWRAGVAGDQPQEAGAEEPRATGDRRRRALAIEQPAFGGPTDGLGDFIVNPGGAQAATHVPAENSTRVVTFVCTGREWRDFAGPWEPNQ